MSGSQSETEGVVAAAVAHTAAEGKDGAEVAASGVDAAEAEAVETSSDAAAAAADADARLCHSVDSDLAAGSKCYVNAAAREECRGAKVLAVPADGHKHVDSRHSRKSLLIDAGSGQSVEEVAVDMLGGVHETLGWLDSAADIADIAHEADGAVRGHCF